MSNVNYKVKVSGSRIHIWCYILITDPVCKMEVDEHETEFSSKHGYKDYYFCSAGCKTTFEKNPEKYAK